ncbi:MAG: acyl carrier protein [Magnetococcales bacterium]|nr:acyl carrier protein [Magnetococcales bacterium]
MSTLTEQVAAMIVETFRLDPGHLPERLDADSIVAWDSLGHLQLMARIQETFGLQLTVRESVLLLDADAIVATVVEKTANRL